jgi:hypothetical protein
MPGHGTILECLPIAVDVIVPGICRLGMTQFQPPYCPFRVFQICLHGASHVSVIYRISNNVSDWLEQRALFVGSPANKSTTQ